MKQFPFLIHGRKELLADVEQVSQEAKKMKALSGVLVSIFMNRADPTMLQDMKQMICAVFPEAQIIGAVSTVEIIDGCLVENDIVVNFTLMECSSVRVMSFDFRTEDSEAAGRSLLAVLDADRHAAAVEVISAGFHLNINPFFRQASRARNEILFFGGLADDGSLGQNGMVFTQDALLRHGIAVAVFSGKKLHVQTSSSFGWKPLGRFMTVTKMDGEFCVQELDGKPAMDVFERYLDIGNDDRFLTEALTFPFYFERNGVVLARHPRRCLKDGSVMFGADFRVGERVRLAYGDPGEIIDNALVLQNKMASFRPEAVFVVSCVARWMLLGSDTEQELSITRRLAPSAGFYAYGEFMRTADGQIMVSNMTLVLIGMREGLGKDSVCRAPSQPLHLRPHRSIMAHLVHFIERTTQELEESNAALYRLARTDYLTGLLNRGETENRLRQLMAEFQLCRQPVAVFMLDVDDFKLVNDRFGHAMGDCILQLLAGIIREVSAKVHAVAGRWGGDEFLAVCPDLSLEEARKAAEQIRKHVAEMDPLSEKDRVTVSIGVVAARPGDTAETVFERVDQALYEAKQLRGKNTVVIREDS